MIDGVTNADALPALERLVQFAGRRHEVITHDIANLETPDFRPVDVSVDDFQASLGAAIDRRREDHGNAGGELTLEGTDDVEVREGSLVLRPRPIGDNILFHDRNDRDPERLMQALVENFMTFRSAAELYRSRSAIINTAIRERI
jgi:flagellar basal body rod protein FlgB